MELMAEPIAITGVAFASPFGSEPAAFWAGVLHGPTPIAPWAPPAGLPCPEATYAPLKGELPPRPDVHPSRTAWLALDLARRALANAGLRQAPAGCGLSLGSCWAETDFWGAEAPTPLLAPVAAALGIAGPTAMSALGCAASNAAIAWACGRLRAGEAPCMLAGGLDLAGPAAVGAYSLFGILAEHLPRPYDAQRDGFLLGEGGAVFLLEPASRAHAAGRRVLGWVEGVGMGHDAAHPSTPVPDGRGLVRAMQMALRDAGRAPDEVDYVNGHAPGTPANDPGEGAAIATVFGPHGVPVSSTKGALGHAQGGANGLEAVACLMAMQHGVIPPTLNLARPDPTLALDLVRGGPRDLPVRRAMSIASSMGGACVAVLLSVEDDA